MSSFPWDILQAPHKYYGLGLTNLYHKQGIQHLLALLQYRPHQDNATGKLLRLGLETMRLELGLNGKMFLHDWHVLHLLVTPTWLSQTWRFQTEYNISIDTCTPEIPLSQEGDQLLMMLFSQAGTGGEELATLNRCRIFLQVVMLANILDGSGHYISDQMLSGQPNTTFASGYNWLNQGNPTKKEWAIWHQGLQLAIPVGNTGRFLQPLGQWLLPWDKHPHHWNWLVGEQPPQLYHWDKEWQIHMPLTTRGTWQLQFSKHSSQSTHILPTMAQRVTCTYDRTHI